MYISAKTLDDLMHSVIKKLLKRPFYINTTRSAHHGNSSEIINILLHLKNPRARLSRSETRGKPFSALGELLWYLSKENRLDFISYYIPHYKKESENGKTIYGGYGPRLFNFQGKHNQVKTIIKLLKKKPFTRRAVIQLFAAEDNAKKRKEVPCTCTLQFILRKNKLSLLTNMRSNDAYMGLTHDIFAFTMLQEIIARALKVELGTYSHMVGSLHLYEQNKRDAQQYIDEGYQSTKSMPAMPEGNPWPAIKLLLQEESNIRLKLKYKNLNNDPYWVDLSQLLKIHSLFKNDNYSGIKKVKSQMHSNVYNMYIDGRLAGIKGKRKKK